MATESFSLRFVEACAATHCPECAAPHPAGPGPRLFAADADQPLCRACARRLAPNLDALIELASKAERVGRKGRQLLTPPMEVLLDLARSAENYALVACRVPARVR